MIEPIDPPQVASSTASRLRSASLAIALAAAYTCAARVPMNGWAACAACATVAFVFLMLIATTSMQRVFAIGAGLALAILGVASPRDWVLVTWGVVCILGLAYAAFPRLRPGRVPVATLTALGAGFPAGLLVAIALFGGADSVRAFEITLGEAPAAALLQGGRVIVVAGMAVSSLDGLRAVRHNARADRTLIVLARVAGAAVAALLLARLTWVLSVATLPTDAVSWSEPPFLVNMLKLRAGAVLYGPLEDVNSYTYSPGMDLLQYALLRPLGLELSLGAHRSLALAWQALAVAVLTWALRRPLEPVLSQAFGRAAPLALAAAVAVAIVSGTNAPNVHPDQPVKLLFAIALAFVIELPALSRRSLVAGLVLLPPLATMCKLTAAGIGVGLGLALIADRRPRWLVVLGAGGVMALATIPLFDALFGHFTTYAIRVQASHFMEWRRAWSLPWRPEGQAVLLAAVAVSVASMRRPRSATVTAAGRVLLLTAGFGGVSSISYLKRGGLDNNLVVWTVGATIAFLLVAAEIGAREARGARACFFAAGTSAWIALSVATPRMPVVGGRRAEIVDGHWRAVAWLRELLRQGHHPLAYLGTQAWIDAGRRDVPRDQLPSATELDLGNWPQLQAHVTRLFDGTYDALLLTGPAVTNNPFLVRLRPRLEAAYDMIGAPHGWPAEPQGEVMLTMKPTYRSMSVTTRP